MKPANIILLILTSLTPFASARLVTRIEPPPKPEVVIQRVEVIKEVKVPYEVVKIIQIPTKKRALSAIDCLQQGKLAALQLAVSSHGQYAPEDGAGRSAARQAITLCEATKELKRIAR